jgi:hypothetical protein
MKKLYFLDEEEKNRILNIHESATKRQYLSEQFGVGQSYTSPSELTAIKNNKTKQNTGFGNVQPTNDVNPLSAKNLGFTPKQNTQIPNPQERQTNITKLYCGLKNGIITTGKYTNVKWNNYVSDWKVTPNEIEIAKKTCPKSNNLQQYRQQVVDKTNENTKAIQKLLGLPETGVMDSSLLQKINEKLNGKPQEAPKSEPLQQLTPSGVKTSQLTTMTPEQLSTGLQQKAAAATAGLKK